MLENFASLLMGFQVVFDPQNIGACMLGAILGLIVGAMPGLGSLAGVALLLPLTYKFEPTTAIIMLGALYYSNMYGGAFSAILLNIPGDSPAITTALDGYPMAKKGRPGQALMAANTASFIGGTIGIIILTITASGLAKLGLNFGYAEMTLVLLIAMTSISWLIGENPTKGVVITMLGILVASIGMDTLTGVPRYNFGSIHLMGGITFTPFIIGAVGSSVCYYAKYVQERLGFDDALEVWRAHGMGGVTGALLLGILASSNIDKVNASIHQFLMQLLGVIIVAVYSFVVTIIIFKVISAWGPIRVTKEEEEAGLDESLHGEEAYKM